MNHSWINLALGACALGSFLQAMLSAASQPLVLRPSSQQAHSFSASYLPFQQSQNGLPDFWLENFCVGLVRLLKQRSPDGGASTTEICFLSVVEAASLSSRLVSSENSEEKVCPRYLYLVCL